MKIQSYKELQFAILADRMMNRGKFKWTLSDRIRHLFSPDYIMRFLVLMRRFSYYSNLTTSNYIYRIYRKIRLFFISRRYNELQLKLGFSIGIDVLGYGVVIPHAGTIVVGSSNEIGNYSVLHTSICIAANGKKIGDGLCVATGAKLTSTKILGNNVMCGANCVVGKDFDEDNILLVGIPASKKKNISAPWYVLHGRHWSERHDKVEQLEKSFFET